MFSLADLAVIHLLRRLVIDQLFAVLLDWRLPLPYVGLVRYRELPSIVLSLQFERRRQILLIKPLVLGI